MQFNQTEERAEKEKKINANTILIGEAKGNYREFMKRQHTGNARNYHLNYKVSQYQTKNRLEQ